MNPAEIDEDDLLNGHLAYEAYIQNRDKGENIKSLEKWNDKIDFNDWDRKVTETLSLVYGAIIAPLRILYGLTSLTRGTQWSTRPLIMNG